MLHDNVAVMRELLLHLQPLIRLRSAGEKGEKKTWWRQLGLLIHSYSLASFRS